jgi:hypothetical protein
VAQPTTLPTKAAKKTSPVEVVDQLYGGEVSISEMVLKDTMPAVQPNAKMNAA